MAVLMTTHSLAEAEALCSRVGVLVDGALAALGTPAELKQRYGAPPCLTLAPPLRREDVDALAAHLAAALPRGAVVARGDSADAYGAAPAEDAEWWRVTLPRGAGGAEAQRRPLAALAAALEGAPGLRGWALASCSLASAVAHATARAATKASRNGSGAHHDNALIAAPAEEAVAEECCHDALQRAEEGRD
jgi:hypothetical protein